MIDFKCHCGEGISVPADQAGAPVQCPRCGRLNDVPTLSDLKNLDADGNYNLDEFVLAPEPERIADATRAFTRRHVDDSGEDIDLRLSMDEIAAAGDVEIPLVDEETDYARAASAAPKYDPLTGELIEPLKIKPDPDIVSHGSLPTATAALSYATARTDPTPGSVVIALLQPGNLFVMGVIFFYMLVCASFQMFLGWVSVFTKIPPYYLNFFWLLVPPHYVIVMDEIGRADRDELPRPWREFSFHDDIWDPLGAFCFCLFVSYGPAWVYGNFYADDVRITQSMHDWIMLLLLVFGSTLFPVLLLTLVTSGTVNNLRPDRLVRTVIASGWRYWMVVAALTVVVILSIWAIAGARAHPLSWVETLLATPFSRKYLSVPLIFTQIYLAHWCAWTMGLLYRSRHANFGWVLQEHVYRNRTHQRFERRRAGSNSPATAGGNRPAARSSVR